MYSCVVLFAVCWWLPARVEGETRFAGSGGQCRPSFCLLHCPRAQLLATSQEFEDEERKEREKVLQQRIYKLQCKIKAASYHLGSSSEYMRRAANAGLEDR
jgi:hypothetical protein